MTSEVSSGFDEVARSSQRRLQRTAYMLTADAHTAEDLVQSVLTRAHRRWKRIGGLEHPKAYLRTMVVNEFLSWRRRLKNRELPLADLADTPSTEDLSTRQVERDAAWRLLATLPRRQRAVLVLRYYEDLPDDEIATVLGCTASTVRSNAARALAALRADLGATR
ncbi:SigE family RNA polymerase sigma factor [Kribbella sp. NPDC051770]|uniref:SigE family RNA polymerase sigma factor n=1 Tax=Kribbella sp. NPDC051770 TaxID=3155413 RepID=UPI003435F4FA